MGLAGLLLLLATSPLPASGSLQDVEHIVIFMQENRAFAHYFGTHAGLRGWNDRAALTLPSGLSSLYQPVDQGNLSAFQLPWHVSFASTSATCMSAPEMDYVTDMGMFDGGRYDAWNTARAEGTGMSYLNRSDLPYYYALYESFVAGDQYHQSTFTQTNPNRLHLFSGSNGLSVGDVAVLDNTEPVPGWTWPTMGEILEDANVSWKLYQEADNFDDNGFAWCVLSAGGVGSRARAGLALEPAALFCLGGGP